MKLVAKAAGLILMDTLGEVVKDFNRLDVLALHCLEVHGRDTALCPFYPERA